MLALQYLHSGLAQNHVQLTLVNARAARDTTRSAPAIAPIAMPTLAPTLNPREAAAADAGLLSVAVTAAGDTSGTVLVLGSAGIMISYLCIADKSRSALTGTMECL